MLTDLIGDQTQQEISIDLHKDDTHLRLIVETGGTGWPMPLGHGTQPDSHSVVFSKAHLLGGEISIEQLTSEGRQIVFCMPVPGPINPSSRQTA
jgi:hypothetical protein